MRVRADLNISLDGVGAPADRTPEDPLGDDWWRLVDSYTATRTFRRMVLCDTSGAGTTGVDDKWATSYFEHVGAVIMGAGMFGLDLHPRDPDWYGYWGTNPPFQVPVLVLTGEERPSLQMEGATVFHFASLTPQQALDWASSRAGTLDVRIGGGPTVVREFLKAGLIDELHVAVAPILLGKGTRLWDGLRGLENAYDVTAETAESGTTHLRFVRTASSGESTRKVPWRPDGNTL